jgi:hypothetical protein
VRELALGDPEIVFEHSGRDTFGSTTARSACSASLPGRVLAFGTTSPGPAHLEHITLFQRA